MSNCPYRTSRLFTQTDQKWAKGDAAWWEGRLSRALAAYRSTKGSSSDDREAKAVVMSELVCLGHALVEHFGIGVQSLVEPKDCCKTDNEPTPVALACVEAGMAVLKSAKSHLERMEGSVEKALN